MIRSWLLLLSQLVESNVFRKWRCVVKITFTNHSVSMFVKARRRTFWSKEVDTASPGISGLQSNDDIGCLDIWHSWSFSSPLVWPLSQSLGRTDSLDNLCFQTLIAPLPSYVAIISLFCFRYRTPHTVCLFLSVLSVHSEEFLFWLEAGQFHRWILPCKPVAHILRIGWTELLMQKVFEWHTSMINDD